MSRVAEAGATRMVRELMRAPEDFGGQIAPITDLQWSHIYDLLDLSDQFHALVSSGKWRQSRVDWSVPVVEGLNLERILVVHQAQFGDLRYMSGMFAGMKHDRDPTRDGSYQVDFRRLYEPDPSLRAHQTIREVIERKVVGCTVIEYKLLNLGLRMTRDKKLDEGGTATCCTGTLIDEIAVPTVEFNSHTRATFIGKRSVESSHDAFRVREVTIPIILP